MSMNESQKDILKALDTLECGYALRIQEYQEQIKRLRDSSEAKPQPGVTGLPPVDFRIVPRRAA